MKATTVREEADRRAVRKVLSDPVTWSPFLPAAAAFAFLGVPWWGSLLVLGGGAAPVALWWRSQWPRVVGDERFRAMKQAFAEEAATLRERLEERSDPLRGLGEGKVVERVSSLPATKQAIEQVMLRDQAITDEEEEIARMVSGLAATILDELARLASPASSAEERTTLRQEIDAGMQVLERTHREIEMLIDPLRGLDVTPEHRPLQEQSDRLHSRLEQARAIRQRLERDLDPLHPGSPPPLNRTLQ